MPSNSSKTSVVVLLESSFFLSKWHLARVLTASKCSLVKNSLPAVNHSTRVGLLPFLTSSTLKLSLISLPILFHWGINLSTSRPFGIDMLPSLRCRKCVGRYGQRSCDISGSALKYMMAWRQGRDSYIVALGVPVLLLTKDTQKNLSDSWKLWRCVNQGWQDM